MSHYECFANHKKETINCYNGKAFGGILNEILRDENKYYTSIQVPLNLSPDKKKSHFEKRLAFPVILNGPVSSDLKYYKCELDQNNLRWNCNNFRPHQIITDLELRPPFTVVKIPEEYDYQLTTEIEYLKRQLKYKVDIVEK